MSKQKNRPQKEIRDFEFTRTSLYQEFFGRLRTKAHAARYQTSATLKAKKS